MTDFTVLAYDATERQIMKAEVQCTPTVLADDVVLRLGHMNIESHVIFTDKTGQTKVCLVTRRRLNEIGLLALRIELLAFLAS
jgi:hypothetical protein